MGEPIKRAWCQVRQQPHYRREAFVAGLRAAGFRVVLDFEPGSDVQRDELLVIWNRYSHWERMAERFERCGARVLVAENGYLGSGGTTPKLDVAAGNVQPGHYYALACSQHNGGGTWPCDDGARWRALGVELEPWRERGHHILVCPQRGIGPKNYAQDAGWANDVSNRLRQYTKRPIRVRPHPGLGPGPVPIEKDLVDCWAVVTWASGAGIHALRAGIPVIYEGPHWILAGAAGRSIAAIEDPQMPDRLPAFGRLACAQWTVQEIASGEPFKRLSAA
jgi:hypothetical protein